MSVSSTIQILNILSGKLSLHCNNVAAVLHTFMNYMFAFHGMLNLFFTFQYCQVQN